jgi:hypothetical protein
MCGHLMKVSLRAASLNMSALSTGTPSLENDGSRQFSRSFMADAIDSAGIWRFWRFNS